MKSLTENLWQAREFAERASVTVRALHHYDRLGILKPQCHTAKGYRLYGEKEFARLQQIMTLKFIGFSLKEIRKILNRKEFNLTTTLRMQHNVIESQRRRLDVALAAIERAESVMSKSGEIDWASFRKIIEVIDMEKNMEWAKKYYSEEAQQKIAERAKNFTPEMQKQVTQDWTLLIGNVEAAIEAGVKPSSDEAQRLTARWNKLIETFTGGDPAIREGLNKLYADQANWQTSFKKPYSDEVEAFIYEAMKARK